MRIQKIMSERGVASRRKSEEMILAGRVTVNGKVCRLGDSCDPALDIILVDGKPLPDRQPPVYIMLHKPRGYVTTLSDEKGRRDVSQLVTDCGRRVYPVGRLDYDSEGLLIMTDDGEFANRLMHPKEEIDKVYHVLVTDYSDIKLDKLRQPVWIDGYKIKKPKVTLIKSGDQSLLEVTIHEGRNRQVRKMCAIAGMNVIRLKRVQEGGVALGDLPVGKWRYMTEDEIGQLK